MPNGQLEFVVRLDDREARAWDFTFMAKRREQSPDKRSFPDAQRTGQSDYVSRSKLFGEPRPESRSRFLVRQDHLAERGMVSVTVVPLPFTDLSSTVPPCASMN